MHDYTLKKIDLDWRAGNANISLLDQASQPVAIAANGVSMLSIPRHLDWGTSVSVNSAEVTECAAGVRRLELSMQSGDVLVLEAATISMPTTTHPDPKE